MLCVCGIQDTLDVGDTLSVCASSHAGRCVAELRRPAAKWLSVFLVRVRKRSEFRVSDDRREFPTFVITALL